MTLTSDKNTIGLTYSMAFEEYQLTKNQNLFEEVIDRMMLEGFAPEFSEKIMSLPLKDKRMAILSLLDKDRDLFLKIKALINTDIGKMDHIKDVILMLRKYVKVGEVEKKKFGEVMTPLELVKEMLATLPEEVWSNPDLKFLDPANGTGPYPMWVIFRLMKGLEEWEPNEEKRYKHIVENMIYVCELQPKNMFLYMCAVDPWDMYRLNIYTGSFLEKGFDKHMKEVWGVEKMDVIMGNYPYQEQKPGFKKTQPLWNLFVKKSMTILEEGGYMVTIHPSGWRNVDGVFKDVQNILKSKQILELHIHNEKDGIKTFGADTRYDFYCVRNEECGEFESKIRCQDGTFDKANLSKMEFIPNGGFSDVFKLMASDNEEKTEILYSRSSYGTDKFNMSKEKIDNFIYPCIYTVAKGDGFSLFYSSDRKLDHFNKPKLIWSNGRIISVGSYIDKDGDYGLTQFAYAIVDSPENLDNIKKAFDSKRFRSLMELCAVGDMTINRKAIATFKKDFWKEFI